MSASEYIADIYNEKYFNVDLIHTTEDKDKDKDKEPHEAIRPTNIYLSALQDGQDNKERKLYALIWKNTVESCMVSATYYSVTGIITAPSNMCYVYDSETIDFVGWKILEHKSQENTEYRYLQTLHKGPIDYKKITCKQSLKGTTSHYTEARLVQLLEEKGIGRPSTFSSIVDKIQERGYVKKQHISGKEMICRDYELENNIITKVDLKRELVNEKSKLVIQPLGTTVIEFLLKHFNKLFEYEYTSLMETDLDKIAKGVAVWQSICQSCNVEINALIGNASSYAVTNNTNTNNTNDIVVGQYEGNDLIIKKGKFGLYAVWGDNSKSLKPLGNKSICDISFQDVLSILEKESSIVREIHSDCCSIRKSAKGDYLFYKTVKMKKPKFYDIKQFANDLHEDYKICELHILKSWIHDTYKINVP